MKLPSIRSYKPVDCHCLQNNKTLSKNVLREIQIHTQIKPSQLSGWEVETSLERNEPGRVGSTNTRPSVLDRLVTDGELSKIMANHLGLDLNLIEGLAIVDSNNAPNHFRYNDHVAKVSSNWLRLLPRWGLPFLFQITSKTK